MIEPGQSPELKQAKPEQIGDTKNEPKEEPLTLDLDTEEEALLD